MVSRSERSTGNSPRNARARRTRGRDIAVAVAVERATSYAKAIGHESVEPVEIADLGLLGGGDSAPVQPVMAFARSGKSVGDSLEGASAADFRPDEIVVSAGVEARFRAV